MSNLQSKTINGYEIRYIFKQNRKDNAHLVVLFNGYRRWGWDFENSINFFKCNILMIDDFFENSQSCYLGRNGELSFSDVVNELIVGTLNDLGLSKSQCTLIGPSKGGFAALYVGLKYDFTNIVAPSFVGHIGTWMINYNKNIASHVMGANYSDRTVEFYDNLLLDLIAKDKKPSRNIYVFLSGNDHYYLEYGQKAVIQGLNEKYDNLNIFFTDSPLSFQHDQVATYFLQEILSVTNLLTQNIAVKLNEGLLDNMGFNVLITPSNETAGLLKKRKENLRAKAVPSNELQTIKVENDVLFVEGLAYLKNYDAPDYRKLHKYLALEKVNGNFRQEFLLGTVPKKDQSRVLYSNVFYDYTASGFATRDFQGIDLAPIGPGTYRLKISISNNKDLREFNNFNLKKGLDQELEIKSISRGFEYRLFSVTRKKDRQVFLTKRPIISKFINFHRYFHLEDYWVRDFKFHLEGVFIVTGVNLYKLHVGNYYLVLRHEETQNIYSYVLGQVLKPNLSEKIGNPYGGYESCYFASMGFAGVNVENLPIGRYEVFISLSHQNEIFTEQVNGILSITEENCFFQRK